MSSIRKTGRTAGNKWPLASALPLAAIVLCLGAFPLVAQQINPMSVAVAETDNSVEAELKSFSMANGYRVELFASEELGIANPCAMRWDEKGRLWVLTIPSYPHPEPGIKADDKLVVLEDTDNDGKADKSTVFADSLHMPLGFELGHGGVYLGQQTELLKLTDTDGDGKADRKAVLLSGFGTHDSHQTINSFVWSPGGELFFSQGHSIYSRVETAWGVKKADRAAIWRYRPLTNQLDVFLDGSTASVNPWGMNFGDWGEMFHKANDPELFYTTPGLVNTSHQQLLPPIGKLIIKGSIIEIVRTKHLPDDLQGDFIVGGYYNNKVERMRVKDDASGYAAELLEPLLSSSSRSFRPVDIKIGPDGAIYVLDWYNPIIGHYQASMRHPDRDHKHGRVWRISAENRPFVQKPGLAGASVQALLEYLKSDEFWIRYHARRLLAEKEMKQTAGALQTWTRQLNEGDPSFERHLVEAMGIYETHEIVETGLLSRLSVAKSAGARGYAARVAGRWHDRLANPLHHLTPLVNDTDPRVRLEALVALSYVQDPQAMVAATQVLDHPMDKFLSHALEKTVHALEPYWMPALKNNTLNFKAPAHLAWLVGYRSPEWWTPQAYRKLLQEERLPEGIQQRLLVNLARIADAGDMSVVTGHPLFRSEAGIAASLSELSARPLLPASLSDIGKLLGGSVAGEIQIAAIRLVKAWMLQDLSGQLTTLLNNRKADEKVRGESLLALVALQGKDALPSLVALGNNPGTPRAVRLASLKALCRLDLAAATRATLTEVKRSDGSAAQIKETVLPLLTHQGGTDAFGEGLKTVSLPKEKALRIQELLGASGIYAPLLSERLHLMAGGTGHISRTYSPAYVQGLAEAVRQTGDPVNGRKVYLANATCTACHAIKGEGGNIGPDLSAIGNGLSVQEIITEVLWPRQNIKEGYNQVIAETKSGEIVQGIKVFENPETVYVKAAGSGKTVALAKKDLKDLTETGSLMPEGLLDTHTEKEVRDLIRFLSDLGK